MYFGCDILVKGNRYESLFCKEICDNGSMYSVNFVFEDIWYDDCIKLCFWNLCRCVEYRRGVLFLSDSVGVFVYSIGYLMEVCFWFIVLRGGLC